MKKGKWEKRLSIYKRGRGALKIERQSTKEKGKKEAAGPAHRQKDQRKKKTGPRTELGWQRRTLRPRNRGDRKDCSAETITNKARSKGANTPDDQFATHENQSTRNGDK